MRKNPPNNCSIVINVLLLSMISSLWWKLHHITLCTLSHQTLSIFSMMLLSFTYMLVCLVLTLITLSSLLIWILHMNTFCTFSLPKSSLCQTLILASVNINTVDFKLLSTTDENNVPMAWFTLCLRYIKYSHPDIYKSYFAGV